MARVNPVSDEWSKLLVVALLRRTPDLNMSAGSNSKVFTIGRELEIADSILKIEVEKDGAADKVDENGATVNIDREEQCRLRVKSNTSNVFAVFIRERERLVVCQIVAADSVTDGAEDASAVRRKHQVALRVDSAQQIGKLSKWKKSQVRQKDHKNIFQVYLLYNQAS